MNDVPNCLDCLYCKYTSLQKKKNKPTLQCTRGKWVDDKLRKKLVGLWANEIMRYGHTIRPRKLFKQAESCIVFESMDD